MSRLERQGKAKEFFSKLCQSDSSNLLCVDCGCRNAQWATVSYGAFLCIECSGEHRSLGVHLSFVRSCTMDSWSDRELKIMEIGGNKQLRKFFFQEQNFPKTLTIRQKYTSQAAEMYRERIKALADGKVPKTIPKIGYNPNAEEEEEEEKEKAESMDKYGREREDENTKQINGKRTMDSLGSHVQRETQSDDWIASFQTTLMTAANITANVAKEVGTAVAERGKVAAKTAAEKAQETAAKFKDKETLAQVQQKASNGWGRFSLMVGKAVDTVTSNVNNFASGNRNTFNSDGTSFWSGDKDDNSSLFPRPHDVSKTSFESMGSSSAIATAAAASESVSTSPRTGCNVESLESGSRSSDQSRLPLFDQSSSTLLLGRDNNVHQTKTPVHSSQRDNKNIVNKAGLVSNFDARTSPVIKSNANVSKSIRQSKPIDSDNDGDDFSDFNDWPSTASAGDQLKTIETASDIYTYHEAIGLAVVATLRSDLHCACHQQ